MPLAGVSIYSRDLQVLSGNWRVSGRFMDLASLRRPTRSQQAWGRPIETACASCQMAGLNESHVLWLKKVLFDHTPANWMVEIFVLYKGINRHLTINLLQSSVSVHSLALLPTVL